MWYYQKELINEISDLPEGAFGFIYKTTHLPTGKQYIGKKSLIYNLKKKLGKNMMFILADPEGNRLDPMPAEQLLKGYRLD